MGHLSASEFVELHQALLVKHARASTKLATDDRGPPLPAEDVTAELVRLLEDLESSGVELGSIASPNAYLRKCVPVALSRARRRRTLLAQVTAGDDLDAVSSDIKRVDAELPFPPDDSLFVSALMISVDVEHGRVDVAPRATRDETTPDTRN